MNILGPDVKHAYHRYRDARVQVDELHKRDVAEGRMFGTMEVLGFPMIAALTVLMPMWLGMWLGAGLPWFPMGLFGTCLAVFLSVWIFHPRSVFWLKGRRERTRKKTKAAEELMEKNRKEHLEAARIALAVRDDLGAQAHHMDTYNSTFFKVTHNKIDYFLTEIEGTPCFLSHDGKVLTRGYDADGKRGVYTEGPNKRLVTLDKDTLDAIHDI